MSINLPILTKFDNRGVKNAQSALGKFGKFAAATAAAATAAVAGIAVVSIKEFAKFDAALTKSTAIMGDVSDALVNDMSEAAREVAKTTTFSAEQAAESYYFLASAGLDAAASIKAMPAVAAFAQAGMFDMALATDLLTDAQSALGLAVKDDAVKNMENMITVSDTLARASQLANATIEQFSVSLTTKAGTALKTVGKDIQEGAAALAVFADAGVKGELAGTQLTNTIFGLSDRAGKIPDDFKALGIEVFDASGKMSNFADIADDFGSALDGMTTEQKLATLSNLGFSKQARAGILLMIGNGDALRNYESELRNAGGTAQEVADKQLTSMANQFELVKSKIADVGIEIGGNLAPMFIELLDEMEPVIKTAGPALIDFFKAIGPVIAGGLKLLPIVMEAVTIALTAVTVAVRDNLYPAFLAAFGFIKDNVATVATFVGVLGTMVGVFTLVSNAAKISTAAQLALVAVMGINPFYLIAIAVAALAAGIVYVATQTTFFQDAWAAFTQFFVDAYNNYVKPAIEAFKAGINALWENAIKPVFEAAMLIIGIWAGIWVAIFNGVISPVLNGFMELLGHFRDFFVTIFGILGDEFKKVGKFFVKVYNSIIKPIFDTFAKGFEALGKWLQKINKDIIQPAFETLGAGFKWVYDNVIEPVAKFMEDRISTVGETFKTVFQAVYDFMSSVFGKLANVVKVPINAIIGFVNSLIRALNTIQVSIPSWVPVFGGMSYGINIPSIPQLADGGIVMPRPGGVLANLAEAGKPEAVIPLDRMDSFGGSNTYNVNVTTGVATDPVAVGREVVNAIKRFESTNGKVFVGA
jgi:TP901 family phage tail tape measure protein